MKRLHLEAKNHTAFIETTDTPEGHLYLLLERRVNPIFKRQRIKEILQLFPSEVPMFKVIER
jgi:hypothetical protein